MKKRRNEREKIVRGPKKSKRKARRVRGGRVFQFGCFIFKVSRVTKRKGERVRGE